MKKLIMLFATILIASGCSASYTIDLDNDLKKEDIKIYAADSTEYPYIDSISAWPQTALYDQIGGSESPEKIPGLAYYDVVRASNYVSLNYNFKASEYMNSTAVKTCYQYVNYEETSSSILLSTSNENKCLRDYGALTSINIIVKTSANVTKHNADKVSGNQYIWEVNKSNYTNKGIFLQAEKKRDTTLLSSSSSSSEEIEKKGTSVTTILILLGVFVVVLFFVVKFVSKKKKS